MRNFWKFMKDAEQTCRFYSKYEPISTQRCRPETEKNVLEDLFSSVWSHFKKYHPSGNLNFNNLGSCQSLKLRNLMGKILRISLKLNFLPNTLGCYGLNVIINTSLVIVYSSKKSHWDSSNQENEQIRRNLCSMPKDFILCSSLRCWSPFFCIP